MCVKRLHNPLVNAVLWGLRSSVLSCFASTKLTQLKSYLKTLNVRYALRLMLMLPHVIVMYADRASY